MRVIADDAKPSHGCWFDDERLLVTMVFPTGWTEYRLIHNDAWFEILDENLPHYDGHPTFAPSKEYLLTDCYPDKFGEQKFEIFDFRAQRLICLGNYIAGLAYMDDELRCDLHLRWSLNGDHIVFDSPHRGVRAIYVLDLLSGAVKPNDRQDRYLTQEYD